MLVRLVGAAVASVTWRAFVDLSRTRRTNPPFAGVEPPDVASNNVDESDASIHQAGERSNGLKAPDPDAAAIDADL